MNDTAIILTAFGTSTKASSTYDFFEQRVREHFPAHDVYWAYTSRTLRKKMAGQGAAWLGPDEILQQLTDKGYRRAVFQSLHIVPGREFEKISHAADVSKLPVSVGMPLLSDAADCEQAINALHTDIADPTECVTVLVGHGTPHAEAQAVYNQFRQALLMAYPRNVFLGMVEGEPSWEHILPQVRRSGLKTLKFLPLMFVAGDHMISDVMGDEDSWAAGLSGFAIHAHPKGLGFNNGIADIYFQHLQAALKRV